MPITAEMQVKILERENSKLTGGQARDQRKIAKLEQEKKSISARAEQQKNAAKAADERCKRVELRNAELELDAGKRAAGTYAVRTTQARTVGGEHRAAGELLGWLTPCQGNEPIHLVHAVYYRTGQVVELSGADAVHDAKRGAEALEKLAEAENSAAQLRESLARAEEAIAAKDAEIARLGQELDESIDEEPQDDEEVDASTEDDDPDKTQVKK